MKIFWLLLRLLSPRRRSARRWRLPRVILPKRPHPVERVLRGRCWVIDGDTIVIDKIRIRLAGIDAPELDHPWGQRSKWALVQLCKGQVVTARIKPEMSYDRLVAECFLPDGRDLAAELVRCGLALDWPKFSGGKYSHLETIDARRALWRADARRCAPAWQALATGLCGQGLSLLANRSQATTDFRYPAGMRFIAMLAPLA